MTCDYIKQEIPEAISEEGGARVQMVNKNTVPLATSVREAKEGLYVLGDEQLIRGEFQGLFKSMATGVTRDGHSRQIGDFVTVYAQPEGPVDLERGWDPAVNSFRLKARLLNEMVLDITDWTFRDVTPGRVAFKLNSVSTGEMSGLIESSKSVHINGSNLPSVATATVEWAIEGTTQSGTIAAAKLTGDCDRIDIAADAMTSIVTQANDGKTIVFTVRGNFANAKISGLLKYVPPADPTYPIETEDGKVAFTDPAALNLFGNVLDCTFSITKGLTEIDPVYARTHTTLSKSLTDPSGAPECTLASYDSTLEKFVISFGPHDAHLGDKRYVHLGYAEGKTVVLPVTVTDEES